MSLILCSTMQAPLLAKSRACLPLSRSLSLSASLQKRPNVSKPHHPPWERKKLLEISRPVYQPGHLDTGELWRDCPRREEEAGIAKKETANDFELLYAKEFRELLENSRVVAIFHHNHLTYYPEHYAWQNARRMGYEMKNYNKNIAKAALEGTKWANLLHFWDTNVDKQWQFIAFGKEPAIKKLLQLDKKIPEMFLLGAIVDNRMLNKKQLQNYLLLPTLDHLRGELCSILQMPARKTSSLLGANQQTLARNLEQYVKDQTK